jgi:hypothetical protein
MNGFLIVNGFVEVGITDLLQMFLEITCLDTLAITEAEEGSINKIMLNQHC